ncbi:MAG: SDR family NAD(P)-dependent oxidoreductase [Acidobacteria bacterium]|nr:MAG: SDR family NAD(P)-dependent oxidoreductase [Acidobacteriota bacterium]REK01445.1 MAG: SDR family NAD(P)-dependent oxidoreductase [Acidobacteriota bacterium]REK14401.1 MAG: SDR family NAD(P)-dependent oxidoreductase [Acidobacteriota bacterium]REK45116.1 MAG: SDR family NAD(P)-dependent oxidoreductase [Acidobacteriota bacterium]
MSTKRVLVLGGTGMLGHKLVQVLPDHGYEVWASLRGKPVELSRFGLLSEERIVGGVEATDVDSIRQAFVKSDPDVVVNAVGVVKQKREAGNATISIEINSLLPNRLYDLCREFDSALLSISTDCVFKGDRGRYDEEDATDAEDLYGRSKALGEIRGKNAVTIRTSIIGRELRSTQGLLEWFISQNGQTVFGFKNAFFSGLSTEALANAIARYVLPSRQLEGIYHVSADRISKFELLKKIRAALDLDIKIVAKGDPRIDRSLDSTRFSEMTGFEAPSWDDMIRGIAEDPTPYEEWRKLST